MTNVLLAIIRFVDRILVVGMSYNVEENTAIPTVLVLLAGTKQELIVAPHSIEIINPELLTEICVEWALMTQIFTNTSCDVLASSYITTADVAEVIDRVFKHLIQLQHNAPPLLH